MQQLERDKEEEEEESLLTSDEWDLRPKQLSITIVQWITPNVIDKNAPIFIGSANWYIRRSRIL